MANQLNREVGPLFTTVCAGRFVGIGLSTRTVFAMSKKNDGQRRSDDRRSATRKPPLAHNRGLMHQSD
jgi:hypothetical protein